MLHRFFYFQVSYHAFFLSLVNSNIPFISGLARILSGFLRFLAVFPDKSKMINSLKTENISNVLKKSFVPAFILGKYVLESSTLSDILSFVVENLWYSDSVFMRRVEFQKFLS